MYKHGFLTGIFQFVTAFSEITALRGTEFQVISMQIAANCEVGFKLATSCIQLDVSIVRCCFTVSSDRQIDCLKENACESLQRLYSIGL